MLMSLFDMLLTFFNVRAVFLLSPPLEILSSGIPVSTSSEQKLVTCWSWRGQSSFIRQIKKKKKVSWAKQVQAFSAFFRRFIFPAMNTDFTFAHLLV